MILLFFAEPFFSWLSKAKQRYDDLTFCTGGDLTYASVKNRRSIVKEYIVGPNNMLFYIKFGLQVLMRSSKPKSDDRVFF